MYNLDNFVQDLIACIVCLNNNYEAQKPILEYFSLNESLLKEEYYPIVKELRVDFKNTQNEVIGGPDKILIMLLIKLTEVLKEYPKEMSKYIPYLIQSQVQLIDWLLDTRTDFAQSVTISDGSDIKCLRTMLESIKPKILDDELIQYTFKVFHKLLFFGTLFENYVTKWKWNRSDGNNTDEEEKSYTKYKANVDPLKLSMFRSDFKQTGKFMVRFRASSDPSSTGSCNCGNKLNKTAVTSRLRLLVFSCISKLCQHNHKSLVKYYILIFPNSKTSQTEKDSRNPAYYLSSFNLDKILQNKNDEDERSCLQIALDLSPKSHIKLPKGKDYFENNWTNSLVIKNKYMNYGVRFIEELHHLLHYLWNHNPQVHWSVLKCLELLIRKSPYAKLKSNLISETVLPLILSVYEKNIEMVADKRKPGFQNKSEDQKILLWVFFVMKELFNIKELRHELRYTILAFDDKNKNENFFRFILRSFDDVCVETLEMLGKNYPEMLTHNWELLKQFLNKIFSQSEYKLRIGCLQMIEEWLNNFNKEYNTDSRSCASDFDDKNTKETSSWSSVSKISDEEEKTFENTNTKLDAQNFDLEIESWESIDLQNACPFKYEDFWGFLIRIFEYFLNESEKETYQDWNSSNSATMKHKGVFLTLRMVTAINTLYYKQYKCNISLMPTIIERLYESRFETKTQDWMRNSWIVANICWSWDLNQLENDLRAKLLAIAIMYNNSDKDKILSNSSRALGYIISKLNGPNLKKVLQLVNKDESFRKWANFGLNLTDSSDMDLISLDIIISILIEKIQNIRPKIAWNSCVSLGNIIEQCHIREFKCKVLFSDECFDSFIDILKNRPNYKVKIHVAQTLAKYKSFEEFGARYFEIILQCLETMSTLFNEEDKSGLNYIGTLQLCLIDLLLHMFQLIKWDKNPSEICSKFFTEYHDLIRKVFEDYIK